MQIDAYHGTHAKNEASIRAFGFLKSKETEYLGEGVYFFEKATFCDALEEAKCWCKFVKKYEDKDIIVFQASIVSEKILDLVDNIEHRKIFDEVKKALRLELKLNKSATDKSLEDFRVFHCIDKKKAFDVIRALIDGAKREADFHTNIVRRPQIQICVKDLTSIKTYNIIYRHQIGRYKQWTTLSEY